MWLCSWLLEISSSRRSSILIDQEQCLIFNINVWNTLFPTYKYYTYPLNHLGSKRLGECLYIKNKIKTINQLDNGRLEIWCVFHLSLELTRDSWRNTFKMVQPPRMNMYVLDSNHMVNTDSYFSFSTHYDNESPLVFLSSYLFFCPLESLNTSIFFFARASC